MDFSTFRQKIGKRVKELRIKQLLTQEDMDNGDDGIPYRTIQNIEGGRSNPNLRTIYRLAKRLKVKPKDILDVQ